MIRIVHAAVRARVRLPNRDNRLRNSYTLHSRLHSQPSADAPRGPCRPASTRGPPKNRAHTPTIAQHEHSKEFAAAPTTAGPNCVTVS